GGGRGWNARGERWVWKEWGSWSRWGLGQAPAAAMPLPPALPDSTSTGPFPTGRALGTVVPALWLTTACLYRTVCTTTLATWTLGPPLVSVHRPVRASNAHDCVPYPGMLTCAADGRDRPVVASVLRPVAPPRK